jgi:hypothetical protein
MALALCCGFSAEFEIGTSDEHFNIRDSSCEFKIKHLGQVSCCIYILQELGLVTCIMKPKCHYLTKGLDFVLEQCDTHSLMKR